MNRKPLVVRNNQGRQRWLGHERFTNKLTARNTYGEFMLVEVLVLPSGGPPPHTHSLEDEVFFVLEGELHFIVDDKTVVARPGDCIVAPRGGIHNFSNPTQQNARMLVIATGGNFDRFVDSVAVEQTNPPALTEHLLDQLVVHCERHDITMLPEHRPDPRVVPAPQSDERLWVWSQKVHLHCRGRDLDRRMTVFTVDSFSADGPPPHVHVDEDEAFYVLEGQYTIFVGEESVVANPGDVIYIPRGTTHTFSAMQTGSKTLVIATPSRLEDFFREVGIRAKASDRVIPENDLTPDEVEEIATRHGMTIAVPAMAQ